MIFTETKIRGSFIVDVERREDERGFFARAWCRQDFENQGLCTEFVQANLARSDHEGTLRGLHYQAKPHQEAKLIRCTQGAIFDVIVDLRPDMASYGEWIGVELSAENARSLYVPEGCAHGYQTLTNHCEVFYLVSTNYAPEAERGIRYDDSTLDIAWPKPVQIISTKDRALPDFSEPRL